MARTVVAFFRTDCKEFNELTKDLGDIITSNQFTDLDMKGFEIGMKLGIEEPLATICDKGSQHYEEYKDKPNYIQKIVKFD